MNCRLILAVALASGSASAQTSAPKPPVGVPSDAKHFNGKWYKVYLEKVPWQRAKEKCATVGGQLVVVPDAPTWAYVRQLANGLVLWLGATDEKTEGLWIWVGGTPMTFKAWDRDQPSNGSGNEHYAVTSTKRGWNDASEANPRVVGYICEWKAK